MAEIQYPIDGRQTRLIDQLINEFANAENARLEGMSFG